MVSSSALRVLRPALFVGAAVAAVLFSSPPPARAQLSLGYKCTGDQCTCDSKKKGDCAAMEIERCCPPPLNKRVFCGDEICGYDDTHGCKCTDVSKPPIISSARSCEGVCGSAYDPEQVCQCDADCSTYGDCCSDYGRCMPRRWLSCSCEFGCGLPRLEPCCHRCL